LACTEVVESGVKKLVIYRRPDRPVATPPTKTKTSNAAAAIVGGEPAEWLEPSSWQRVGTVAEDDLATSDLANCVLFELILDEYPKAAAPAAAASSLAAAATPAAAAAFGGSSSILASYRHHTQPHKTNGTWGLYSIMSQRSEDGAVRGGVPRSFAESFGSQTLLPDVIAQRWGVHPGLADFVSIPTCV
jgi:hypothetical protein